jgi:hypothetical protein
MRATFGLLVLLLSSSFVFAHEHTNAVPEIDRKFLDNLQRPDTVLMIVATRNPNHAAQTRMP